jgi:DNA-binding transcriptional MerR regulator
MGKGYKIYKTRDFIRKTEDGRMNLGLSLKIVRELAEAANFHKEHNLMIDLRDTTGMLDIDDLFRVIIEFVRHKDIFRNKIAILMPTDEERLWQAGRACSALANQNFTVNYFVRYEDAIEWFSVIADFS